MTNPKPTATNCVARIHDANAAAWDLWTRAAAHPTSWVRPYLAGRGLPDLPVGHAQDTWDNMTRELHTRGFTDAELIAAGLAVRSRRGTLIDRFRDRLVLPVRDTTGKIAGFTARKNPAADDDSPKYLNTAETAAYRKSEILYGLDAGALIRLAAGARPVLVEGALDAEAINTTGTDLVGIAPCGTALTARQLDALRTASPEGLRTLIAGYDSDAAGTKATVRLWDALTGEESAHVRAITLPAGTDPADLIQQGKAVQLREAIEAAGPIAHAVIDAHLVDVDPAHLEQTIAATRAIAAQLVHLPSPELATATVHLLAALDGRLSASTVLAVVFDATR